MFMHGSATEHLAKENFKEVLHLNTIMKNFYNENMKYILSFCDSFDKAKKLCKNEESILEAEKLETGRYMVCI